MYTPPLDGQEDLPAAAVNGPEVFRADTSDLSRFVPKSKLRRVDHYSRMALLAAGRAMEGIDPALVSREETGLIVATGYGALNSTFSFLDSYIENGDKLAAPTHFSGSVHNAAAAHIAICYGITGPCLTVSQFDLSFISALITAGTWLETKKAGAVLVGTTDEWSEVIGYCMDRFSKDMGKPPGSFGEGAAFFLLTRESGAAPEYGFFEDISMGRGMGPGPDRADIIFSPPAAACSTDMPIGRPPRENFVRRRGGSPTDTGMDALFALSRNTEKGERICCLKQGQDGMFGRMTITR